MQATEELIRSVVQQVLNEINGGKKARLAEEVGPGVGNLLLELREGAA